MNHLPAAAAARIVYFQEPSFSLPAWFLQRLNGAIRRGAFGSDFARDRDQVTTLLAAASRCGFNLDHLGRRGPLVTCEPYEFSDEGLSRFCDALELEASVLGPSASPWNGEPDFEGFRPSVLIVFRPKGL